MSTSINWKKLIVLNKIKQFVHITSVIPKILPQEVFQWVNVEVMPC